MLNFGKVFKRKTQTPKTERLGNLVADAFHLHGFSPNPAPGPASRAWPLTFESFPCVFEVAKRLLFRHVSGMVDEHTGGGKLGWYLFPATKNTRDAERGPKKHWLVQVPSYFLLLKWMAFLAQHPKKNITSQVYTYQHLPRGAK